MNNNLENIIKIILNILIVGAVVYIVAKLFIFILPVIIVLIVVYYIYKIFLESKDNIKVIDADVLEEKFDK